MPHKEENPSVAVERALSMLEIVAQEPEGMSNAEISRKLQIPKSSASYILRTLEKQNYVNRDEETGKYRVGLKILSLSRGALSGIDVREVALPIMRNLMEKTNLTCHLAILDGPEAVYIPSGGTRAGVGSIAHVSPPSRLLYTSPPLVAQEIRPGCRS